MEKRYTPEPPADHVRAQPPDISVEIVRQLEDKAWRKGLWLGALSGMAITLLVLEVLG